MPWNQLPPSERRRLMSSWWRSWSSWAAGHAMQPAHPKKNKPSGGFCWGRFCWVYVEFMLSLCWVYFGLLLDDFQTLGNRSNLQTWAIMDFPLDFSGISHWFPQRDHHQPQEARRAVPYRRPGSRGLSEEVQEHPNQSGFGCNHRLLDRKGDAVGVEIPGDSLTMVSA